MASAAFEITEEEVAKLRHLGLEISPDNVASIREQVDMCAMLGGELPLADDDDLDDPALPHVILHLGHLPLLHLIDSPLVSSEGDIQLTLIDVACAVYVLVHGQAALGPVTKMHSARQRLAKLEKWAEKSPQHFEIWLNADQRLLKFYDEFQSRAMDMYADIVLDHGIQALADGIVQMLNAAFRPLSLVPDDATEAEKKTALASALRGSVVIGGQPKR